MFVCGLWLIQRYLGLLEYDRQQILTGQLWRIWSGHFVHTNSAHFALNIVAALIIYFGFLTRIKLRDLLLSVFVFAALISLTLLCVYPSLDWYNGLSGLLHALVAYFAVRMARTEDKIFWAALVVIWVKVIVETVRVHLGYESTVGEMAIITEAHLIGTFFGTVAGFALRKSRSLTP
ncbi:Uncharacterised protein [Halioglobus japonicus]|nr:Uncharacterised protein [Halioglobus japonicus]